MRDYDYSQSAEYFVTICTYGNKCSFGEILQGKMILSAIGNIVENCWKQIPIHFHHIELDEYTIMPNHIHGILIINDYSRDVQLNVPTRLSPKKWTLSVVIRTFKAAVTTECRRRKFNTFHWQPRFYEHIIRDDKDLNNIRDYIANNIIQWSFDKENPQNIPFY
ncbi:MAG: transposase [Bacteroidetes bacterium]|nr:transposase [Bacteroidota bacterium]